jgi:polysaccharide biosynthesis/export protein
MRKAKSIRYPGNVLRSLPCAVLCALFCLVLANGDAGAQNQVQSQAARALVQQAIQNQGGQSDESPDERPVATTVQTYQPASPSSTAPSSHLEEVYSNRAGQALTQFGYETLGVPSSIQVGEAGAMQDSYVIGQGDEIVVVLRGQENATYRQRVNRDGQIILPKLNPVQAMGRTFGDFRADLEAQIHQAFISTNAYVTLGEIRQVSVLVAGEVRAPGTRILSALASPLDAILLSGGISKTGSLRSVTLVRDGAAKTIDLYAVLVQGGAARLGTLHDGDRIYVPPLGHTVAVTGSVRRSGIFELAHGESAISTEALMRLAGGVEIAGGYRLSKMALGRNGATELVSTTQGSSIRDGEILFVDAQHTAATARVTLLGAVQAPGPRPRSLAPSIGKMITGVGDLTPDAYTMMAVIVRKDPRSNAHILKPFSLEQVLSGASDEPLGDDDIVYIFTADEARALAKEASVTDNQGMQTSLPGFDIPASTSTQPQAGPNLQSPGGPDTLTKAEAGASAAGPAGTSAQGALASSSLQVGIGTSQPAPDLRTAMSPGSQAGTALATAAAEARKEGLVTSTTAAQANAQQSSVEDLAETLGVTRTSLVSMAAEHLVWVVGAVGDPGPYLGAEGSTLRGMMLAAGGALRVADLSWVEDTSTEIDALSGTAHTSRTAYKGRDEDFAKATVRPLDVIRLREVYADTEGGRVTVNGEVRYPGTFDVLRGEKLSAVLERAGGLTDQAYPYGAVVTRQRAAVAEREGNTREADQLEAELGSIASSSSSNATVQQQNLQFLKSISDELRTAPVLGRITTVVDPAVLQARPDLDIVLEAGDTIFIPKRPTTIAVTGEVLNPGSFQYQPGLSIEDYVTLAGGTTRSSDANRTFVVMPDGTARPAQVSWLSIGSDRLPPGSTVVVPRDLTPFDTMEFLKSITQVISQLAVTGASIAVIAK